MFHQWKRTDKTAPRVRKRSQITKRPKVSGERAMFDSIWDSRDRVSYLSGRGLERYGGTELYLNMFAHVLSKSQSKYPKFKLLEKNIILLTPREHHLLDHGTEAQREAYTNDSGCSWDRIWALRAELEKEYIELYGGPRRFH